MPSATSRYEAFHRRSLAEREAFWAEEAGRIDWHRPWQRVLDYSRPPFARWFVGGETNLCHNAVDRHVAARGEQTAIAWVSTELGRRRNISYRELHRQVRAYAAALRSLGVGRGDRIVLYLPMVPEALAVMLAAVRLGAIHSVVFAGFAPPNLAQRIDDCRPRLIVTADAGLRGGRPHLYKALVDQAVALARHKPAHVLVLRRGIDPEPPWTAGRDLDLEELSARHDGAQLEPEWVESNHPSYILYTSGTTGGPKGVQRDTGGYATALASSMKWVYGCAPGETFFTTSDIGWVVGHSYLVYAPLLNGNTTVMHEGTPVHPDPGVWWRIVAEHGVHLMYSAPTAMRLLRQHDARWMREPDTRTLRHLYLGGEPLEPATYAWVAANLGADVLDNYWQTESGWPMLLNCAGLGMLPVKPGSPSRPVYGWELFVAEPGSGRPLPRGEKGILAARPPLPPGSLTTVWDDDARFLQSYYSHFAKPLYFTGDYAVEDGEGYFFILGRADEVINVAGHRLGTREVEEAIAGLPDILEAAAVGVRDGLKGQAIVALVVLRPDCALSAEALAEAVRARVEAQVGALARPREVRIVSALPKTRSGKVIRRAIAALAEGRDPGDLSTLEDEGAIAAVGQAWKSDRSS